MCWKCYEMRAPRSESEFSDHWNPVETVVADFLAIDTIITTRQSQWEEGQVEERGEQPGHRGNDNQKLAHLEECVGLREEHRGTRQEGGECRQRHGANGQRGCYADTMQRAAWRRNWMVEWNILEKQTNKQTFTWHCCSIVQSVVEW